MNHTEATTKLLDAAETLFYAHGVHAVGMDALRAESGVSLKRLYQCFSSKDELVEAYLRRRDGRWRGSLEAYVEARGNDPLAVFDWLHGWFSEPDFRGCAFVNSFGEFGDPSPGVAAAIRLHSGEVRRYLIGLTDEVLGDRLFTLLEGATVIAAITEDASVALSSRETAAILLTPQQL
ncbi:TetR/AcrR family transcriptional regulator [Amycolatopsis sp. H20-H5]|uniref:TetR/AcrR family transcriptional regulator n=1 Tax=Amycolatopsis sp. H20-H5 TaxID=3046309 RepID=UPI002DB966AF|nr:TetR/AcrR family transcriptional regulator [Amycolatopsis sp. H20-H5]MEC3973845.1 TetR/AcrR family transcriptional regulator [Amycolatopsis sp. H20-H5]